MDSKSPKLLVIGFDGLDYEIFSRRSNLGLKVHPLFAPVPVTGPSWTSIYTGDSVTTHKIRNVFGLKYRKRYSQNESLHTAIWFAKQIARFILRKKLHSRSATPADTPSKYIWQTLSNAGLGMKIVAMPITCPVKEVNGVWVGGFPVVKRQQWCWPPDIAEQVPDDYLELADIIQWFIDPECDSHRKWKRLFGQMSMDDLAEKTTRKAFKLADFFTSLGSADVEAVQFSFVDRIGHCFEISGEYEQFCYDLVEKLIKKLVDALQPESTMIVSDHGFSGPGHTDYGCFALSGAIADRVQLSPGYTPSVLDIAPTLAGYFGCKHPCEGNDLTAGGTYSTRSSESDEAEKAKIIENLKNLGYF